MGPKSFHVPAQMLCLELVLRAVQCQVIGSRYDSLEFRLLLVSQPASLAVGASNSCSGVPGLLDARLCYHLGLQHDLHRVLVIGLTIDASFPYG